MGNVMIYSGINLETGERVEIKRKKKVRNFKGNSLVQFPDNYVVIDIETTGLSPQWDDIIEIAALKVSQGEIVDSYQTFLKPAFPIDDFISSLTGITNEMLEGAPEFEDVNLSLKEFIGSEIILGHNVNFDINFLYDEFERVGHKLSNDFVDTMRLSRRLFKEERHHRLTDIIDRHDIVIEKKLHRAEVDIIATKKVLEALKKHAVEKGIDLQEFAKKNYNRIKYNVSDIKTENTKFNKSSPIYGKHFVFTGKLENMVRREAQQLVKDLGGELDNSVTKLTNFLVLGEQDYSKIKKQGKSSKHIKAEQLKIKGQDINIIPENVFYDFINDSLCEEGE